MENYKNQSIFTRGEKAPEAYFTGSAWVNMLVPNDETRQYVIADVHFEAGCRNNWHFHPAGQILLITEGEGYYQEKGKPARVILKGDVIVIPADVVHWHGATQVSALTHIAITNLTENGPVTWLAPVTDEEYNTL